MGALVPLKRLAVVSSSLADRTNLVSLGDTVEDSSVANRITFVSLPHIMKTFPYFADRERYWHRLIKEHGDYLVLSPEAAAQACDDFVDRLWPSQAFNLARRQPNADELVDRIQRRVVVNGFDRGLKGEVVIRFSNHRI